MSQIICRELSLGYDGVTVCEHLNFTVNKGDYLCIVGENGSGKSTLMKALLGLKAPDGGEIIKGEGMTGGNIGYLPQQSDHQRDFPATVREVVLSGRVATLGYRFFYNRTDKLAAHDAMRLLGICDLADRPYSALSGGQQQRALLARALCAARDIILLDEPVAGLDPVATAEMYKLIEHINKTQGITVIMITHDVSAALKYATSVLHMGVRPQFFEAVPEYAKATCLGEEEADGE